MPENSSSVAKMPAKEKLQQEEQERPQSPQPPSSRQYRPLATRIRRRIEKGRRWFSCEFFPRAPRRPLFARGRPLFCDVTWHPAGNPAGDSPTSSTSVASAMLNYCGIDTVLHLTCVGQTEARLVRVLDRAKSLGLKNILALRGDLPEDADGNPGGASAAASGGPAFASDLVRLIRRRYGSFFCIGVAGYPAGHPEAASYAEDLRRLKEKVDAGGEFIITQLFFESAEFLRFVSDCRRGYQSLRHIVKLSKLTVPDSMLRVIEPIRDNDEAIRNYGIAQCTQMCQELLQSGQVHGIHFYTLNRDAATIRILKNIGLWREDLPRPLPWQPSANYERCAEAVRPVFWSRRPTSYVHRTRHWMTIPTAGGAPTQPHVGQRADQRAGHGGWRVFASHLSGNQSPESRLPWGDEEPLPPSSESNEAAEARQRLAGLSERGLLATNHLLRVNGASSDHPVHGWGGSGGFVYQRAYLEFFLPGRRLPALQSALSSHGGGRVSFHIADRSGNVNLANFSEPIALTWGVFPASEVAQPTVCDGAAFLAWRDEAFALWTEEWGRLYEEGSPSRRLIESVAETYLLVALVDNDFTEDSVLWDLTDQVARAADGSDEVELA
uniref:Methylenetetrahydrofolate reductase n=1 Tax=Macrostomum lignano TaxID=282301 RepID=A0A1I8GKA4_9PLAT